ncbi:hypothetical protein KUTeg_018462 [Tegillarca granosa]|uniref:Maturase K n=1 Tax=Tegillarca granosa TaxID=220873 RepID=A0ABQ9EHU9_TEGGR|nr:hypothetical protein KUTeg_018462 [Tegillarca granosa]
MDTYRFQKYKFSNKKELAFFDTLKHRLVYFETMKLHLFRSHQKEKYLNLFVLVYFNFVASNIITFCGPLIKKQSYYETELLRLPLRLVELLRLPLRSISQPDIDGLDLNLQFFKHDMYVYADLNKPELYDIFCRKKVRNPYVNLRQ